MKLAKLVIKLILSALAVGASVYGGFILYLMAFEYDLNIIIHSAIFLVIPTLLFPLIWVKKKSKVFLYWLIGMGFLLAISLINIGINLYEESLTIDTSPNINVHEYLPFEDESKIIKLENSTLSLNEDLPIVDGAAALFPVYSAFVNAVYPSNTRLYDGVLEYNNTSYGYQLLGQKKTDIFFGAYPSKEQIAFAEENDTEFVYTPIGSEAFVFFVHKDNPVDNLSTEQIQKIYSGEITNWSEVGGKNEEIVAFQRNEGSGSQSMLKRFMGDIEIMKAPSELVNDLMSGIIERVSDYKSKSNSIGFSFRYYVEGIIQNPNIKLVSIDGVAPTVENIKNESYPITTSLYAVTYEGNENPNVKKFIDWILSEEGQYIVEKTGYVPIK